LPTYEADLDESERHDPVAATVKADSWEALAAAIMPVYGPHLPPAVSSSSSSSSSDEHAEVPPPVLVDPTAAAESEQPGNAASEAEQEPASKKPRLDDGEAAGPLSPEVPVLADSLCPGLAESSPPGSPHPVQPKAKSRGKKGKRTKKGKKPQTVEAMPGTRSTKGTRTKKGKKQRAARSQHPCPAREADGQPPADEGIDQDDLESLEPPQDRVIAVASWHHDRA
jgi:hypothetical protein